MRVSVDGHEYEVPDDATNEEIDSIAKPSIFESLRAGATRGLPDRIAARAKALGAQGSTSAPEGRSMAEQLVDPQPAQRPVDEQQFETDRANILQHRRDAGAKANAAHPAAYVGGMLLPAAAAALIPGAGTVQGAATVGGLLGAGQSESDDPKEVAASGATGAALSGAGARLLQLLAKPVNAVGDALLPRAQAIRDRLMSAVGDRSAAAAEATAKSAQGSAGAATANASRLIERLGMREALPAADAAANDAALATPEARTLAQKLAGKARTELPGKLAHVEGASALAEQTAADAAAARSPEAVTAMEKQMRSEIVARLLKRYIVPAGTGYAVDKLTGGSGAMGAVAGLGMRPTGRALVRAATSPAVMAPLSRALVSGAEGLSTMGAEIPGHFAPLLEGGEPKLLDALRALIMKPSASTLAQQP